MNHMEVRIDDGVFLLKDPKVDKLRSGRLSAEAFAMLMTRDDPYVMVDGTVYALTEREYYALRAVRPVQMISEKAFREVVSGRGLERMTEADRKIVEDIRKDLPGCPACRYKRHKSVVWSLAKKYGIEMTDGAQLEEDKNELHREYPETLGKIAAVATVLMDHPYDVPDMSRVPCIDCVEKHLSQAAVLSAECANGYPEYLNLVIGHLAEALDELPPELSELRAAIEFCLAKTQLDRVPFVPLDALAAHVEVARDKLSNALKGATDESQAEDRGSLDVDITDDMRSEISGLDDGVRRKALSACRVLVDFILKVENVDNTTRMRWEGRMAMLADMLAKWAPRTAAMVRARRLMFVADPSLSVTCGYSMEDLRDLLEGEAAGDDVGSGLEAVEGLD